MSGAAAAIAGGAMGLTGSIISAISQKKQQERNIAFQRETNEKNEALMREGWARDDIAVQRRAADLTAAGQSPLLAAGSAANSSTPISTIAPKQDQPIFKPDTFNAMIQAVMSGMSLYKTEMDVKNQLMQQELGRRKQALDEEKALADISLKSRALDQADTKIGQTDKSLTQQDTIISNKKLVDDQLILFTKQRILAEKILNQQRDNDLRQSVWHGLRSNDPFDAWEKRRLTEATYRKTLPGALMETVETLFGQRRWSKQSPHRRLILRGSPSSWSRDYD